MSENEIPWIDAISDCVWHMAANGGIEGLDPTMDDEDEDDDENTTE